MSCSEKKVKVEELDLGMYVSRLDRPWVETRFLFQGFHISNPRDLEELREQCEYVYVDAEKGEAPKTTLQSPPGEKQRDTIAHVFRNVPRNPVYSIVTSVEDEIGVANESHTRAVEVVSSVLDDIRAGRKIQVEHVRHAVNGMIASIIRNPDAFLWLTRLKKKDNYAYAHSVDACGLAVAFGRHLGFSKPELENLAVGALLFDIGKLQLPDKLLNKPGRLTDEEFRLVRRHVEFGVNVVQDMKGTNKDIISTVLHHHERHDGKGYPRGVPGHRIPVNGRIAALVDCYDAITSDRPYHPAMSAYDAVQSLYEWRDKDFQTDMVEQFIQCIGLYPTGTLVELSTGQVGIVMAQNRVRRLRPKILLVLDENKVAYDFSPTLDLIEDPLDDEGNLVEIRHPLTPGTYGIDVADFYL